MSCCASGSRLLVYVISSHLILSKKENKIIPKGLLLERDT